MTDLNKKQEETLAAFLHFLSNDYDECDNWRCLSGAGGTGKTYLARQIADNCGRKVLFLAPTNRAAKILSNAVKEEARTIHSVLYRVYDKLHSQACVSVIVDDKYPKFVTGKDISYDQRKYKEVKSFTTREMSGNKGKNTVLDPMTASEKLKEAEVWCRKNGVTPFAIVMNPSVYHTTYVKRSKDELEQLLEDSLLIVDEFSMIRSEIQTDIVETGNPVLFMGDKNQLPPVIDKDETSSNYYYTDLVHYNLTENMRAASGSGIIECCKDWLDLTGFTKKEYGHGVTISTFGSEGPGSSEKNIRAVVSVLAEKRPDEIYQILCFKKTNVRLANECSRELKGLGDTLCAGEPVIVNRHCRDMKIFKGEIFIIKEILKTFINTRRTLSGYSVLATNEEGQDVEMLIKMPGNSNFNEFDNAHVGRIVHVDFAYAMTVHSSQGSTFDNVAYIDGWSPESRKLVYTAISRARHKLVVFTTKNRVLRRPEI